MQFFSEQKCDEFETPLNGQSECLKKNNTVICIVSCNEGYLFPISSEFFNYSATEVIQFECDITENVWYNKEGVLLEECAGEYREVNLELLEYENKWMAYRNISNL